MVYVKKAGLAASGGAEGGEPPAAKRRRTAQHPALAPEQLQQTDDLPNALGQNAAGSSNWTEAELWQMLQAVVWPPQLGVDNASLPPAPLSSWPLLPLDLAAIADNLRQNLNAMDEADGAATGAAGSVTAMHYYDR